MPKKLIALLLLAVAGSAFAQPGPAAWPAKPVRVIIPYPPGGDVVRARIVAEQKNFAKAVKDANLKPE